MKRRSFIKKMSTLSAAPLLLNGLPVSVLANSPFVQQWKSTANTNGKIVVLVQLHGGNDGLNTLIPVDQYDKYFNLRPNVAIANTGNKKYITLDSGLPLEKQIGLHPSMTGMKELYEQGKLTLIQSAGYNNMNGSHFRGRDIWHMGGNYNDTYSSGWVGRLLEIDHATYPTNYPNTSNPDPLALEIGNINSLVYHNSASFPSGLSVESPEAFHNLINSVGNDQLPTVSGNNHHFNELQYILNIEDLSNNYSGKLKDRYDAGSNSVSYSGSNDLAQQLKIVSRLIAGGNTTCVYLVKLGGFDTHADQVDSSDTSIGSHADLLGKLSEALKTFQDDVSAQGFGKEVLTLTFSEFGRRVTSNGSFGTDHGTAAPMFAIGEEINPGVIGNAPDLNDLDGNNLKVSHDYRQVFGAAVQDWFGANPTEMATIFPGFVDDVLPIIKSTSNPNDYGNTTDNSPDVLDPILLSTADNVLSKSATIQSISPNPFNDKLSITIDLQKEGMVTGQFVNTSGQQTHKKSLGHFAKGTHRLQLQSLATLPSGSFVFQVLLDGIVVDSEHIVKL